MEDIPDLYQLETVEQLRAIADPLRLRIVDLLSHQAMTATQVGEALDLPANKAHYHVRELERVGLVRLVETREKGGILEKYYRLVANDVQVPAALLRSVPPDESLAAAGEVLGLVSRNFLEAFGRAARDQAWEPGTIAMQLSNVLLTNEEVRELTAQIQALIAPYERRDPPEGAIPRTLLLLGYPDAMVQTAAKEERRTGSHTSGTRIEVDLDEKGRGRRRRIMAAGAAIVERKGLERIAAAGEQLDLYVLGYLTIAGDVDAGLADLAIGRVRHKGILQASPAVREVLKRKGAGG